MKAFVRLVCDFLKRFPALVVFALVGVYLATLLTDWPWTPAYQLMAALAMSYTLSATIQAWLERWRARRVAQLVVAVASILVFAYMWWWFRWMGNLEREDFAIRYLLVLGAVAALLAAALCPRNNENRRMPMLCGAAVLGFGSSLAIFACVSLVFLALDKLFGVKIHDIYEFLWYLSMCSILPVAFVLFAVQRRFKTPAMPLKVLLDYILLPVFLVNLAILVAYLAKCVVRLSLPNGEVTWLVSAACTLWLFFHFLCSYDESRFAAFFRAWAGCAIPPLLVLQGVALWLRIRQYGLTPVRYLAIAYSVFFLAAVVLSFIRRGRPFRHVYAVFAAIALFAALSPLNAIDASVYAQRARVRRICEKEGFKVGADFFSKATPEFPQGFPQEAMAKVNGSWRFLSRYRRSCGFYVGKSHDSGRHPDPAGEPMEGEFAPKSIWINDESGSLHDVSQYRQTAFVQICWWSNDVGRATSDQIAALKEQDPPIATVKAGDGAKEIVIRASALIPHILDKIANHPPAIHDAGEGCALAIMNASGSYYQTGDEASPTNIVPVRTSGRFVIFLRK